MRVIPIAFFSADEAFAFLDCGTEGSGTFNTVVQYPIIGAVGNGWEVSLISGGVLTVVNGGIGVGTLITYINGVSTVGNVEAAIVSAGPACGLTIRTPSTNPGSILAVENGDVFSADMAGGIG